MKSSASLQAKEANDSFTKSNKLFPPQRLFFLPHTRRLHSGRLVVLSSAIKGTSYLSTTFLDYEYRSLGIVTSDQ